MTPWGFALVGVAHALFFVAGAAWQRGRTYDRQRKAIEGANR